MNKKTILKSGISTLANFKGVPTTIKPIIVIHPQKKPPFFKMEFPYKKRYLFDNKAQAGGVITLVLGILIIGFFYVAFGGIMNELWSQSNTQIAAGSFNYTQEHRDTMDTMFKFWWSVPILSAIIFIIYTIVIGIRKKPGEV